MRGIGRKARRRIDTQYDLDLLDRGRGLKSLRGLGLTTKVETCPGDTDVEGGAHCRVWWQGRSSRKESIGPRQYEYPVSFREKSLEV